jgi:hypothetical protein
MENDCENFGYYGDSKSYRKTKYSKDKKYFVETIVTRARHIDGCIFDGRKCGSRKRATCNRYRPFIAK